MKKVILIIFISILPSFSFSQNSKSVTMKIEKVLVNTKNIEIHLEFCNDSIIGLTIVKPDIDYTCCSILHIYFQDSITQKEISYKPCTDFADLDAINVDYKNGVYLNPHENYKTVINIDRSFTEFIHSGRMYFLTISYNLEGVNIDTKMDNIFNKNIESNRVLVKIE